MKKLIGHDEILGIHMYWDEGTNFVVEQDGNVIDSFSKYVVDMSHAKDVFEEYCDNIHDDICSGYENNQRTDGYISI